MTSHYLAINEESYDASTVYGIFDTFDEARDYLKAGAPDYGWGVSANAEVQEWAGSKLVTTWHSPLDDPPRHY